MLAVETSITVIDFETTGVVEGHADEAWQIGMAVVRHGRVQPAEQYVSLLRVGQRPFNPYAPGKHHILKAEIERAPTQQALWPALHPWLVGRPLCAHNAAVEKKILRKMAPLHRVGPWLDTLKLVRFAHPDLPSHTLGDVLTALGLTDRTAALCPGREAHDALYDAVGCALLLEYLLGLPGWETTTVESLARVHPMTFHRQRQARS
ncbi:MAG: 3'-5' exonuclease [Spartobacteria bacterium]|nr:3'-5' exonuclease [Spartobacteria bacterium]